MALMQPIKSAANSLKDKVISAVMPAKLEKAKLQVITNPNDIRSARGEALTVQFNPSEYSISRSVRPSMRRPLGRDADPRSQSVVSGDLAVLTVTLYFDTISDLHDVSLMGTINQIKSGGAAGALAAAGQLAKDQLGLGGPGASADTCAEMLRLLKFNRESHQPPVVVFFWGPLEFEGRLENLDVQYTMFNPDGTPVRAKATLRIAGEQREAMNLAEQLPFESPDRTKERTLTQGDQLWMIAGQEYDDPAKWKVIAEANDILNPRKLEGATTLKVPSIR